MNKPVKVVDDWTDTLNVAIPHCKDFSLAIDGGACVGNWSKRLAQHFNRVYAIEPAPDLIPIIEKVAWDLRDTWSVTVIKVALSSKEHAGKPAKLVEHVKRPGKHRSRFVQYDREVSVTVNPRVRYKAFCDVETVTIDFLVAAGPCGLIKLDIEGAEYLALMGATETLRRDRPVVITEYDPAVVRRYIHPLSKIDELLSCFGYKHSEMVGINKVFWI